MSLEGHSWGTEGQGLVLVAAPVRHSKEEETVMSSLETTHKAVQTARERCIVCRLETNMNKSLGEKGLATNVARCQDPNCGIRGHHSILQDSKRYIHTEPVFHNLSCFEILHSKTGKEIWNMRGNATDGFYFTINHAHPIAKRTRKHHGLAETISRKRKNDTDPSVATRDDDK